MANTALPYNSTNHMLLKMAAKILPAPMNHMSYVTRYKYFNT